MPDQTIVAREGVVLAAVERLDEDLDLLETVPIANTQAARTAAQANRLAAHERFEQPEAAA
jgi:hypothetical protein